MPIFNSCLYVYQRVHAMFMFTRAAFDPISQLMRLIIPPNQPLACQQVAYTSHKKTNDISKYPIQCHETTFFFTIFYHYCRWRSRNIPTRYDMNPRCVVTSLRFLVPRQPAFQNPSVCSSTSISSGSMDPWRTTVGTFLGYG